MPTCDPIAAHLSRWACDPQKFTRTYAAHLYVAHLDTEEEDLAALWYDHVEKTAQSRMSRNVQKYLHWPNAILPRVCDACGTVLPHPTHYPSKRCQNCIDASPWSN